MRRFVASALLLVGMAWVSPASAGYSAQIQCHFWADQPSATLATPYRPSTFYSFDKDHGHQIKVTRTSTGFYNVKCTGVADNIRGGTILVTKYSDAGYCIVGGWGGSPDLEASILCYDTAGNPADSYFDFLFVK